MKKVILFIIVVIIGFVIVGIVIGVISDDKIGLVQVISVEPSASSTIAANREITLTAAYIFLKYSPDVDFYAGLYLNSIYGYKRYTVKEKKLTALFGLITFKTTLEDVVCGLDPILRESKTSSEITEKLFQKYATRGMTDRFQDEVVRLKNCRYGEIKYPFELLVQTFYSHKNAKNQGFYTIDESEHSVFKVNQ